MNKLFTFILGMFLMGANIQGTHAQLSSYDQNRPVGFGANTTGGEGGQNITVTTADELAEALEMDGKHIIYIKGEIEVNEMIKVRVEDKTILGLPGSVLTNPNRDKNGSGILYFQKESNNVIMRNVTFKSAGAYDVDGNDNFTLDGATNIWVDHCDFQDGVDGNFDCKSASDNVAVTWCLFQYQIPPQAGGSGGSADHRFSNLWGSSDEATEDRGHLRTTFQFCHWDNCKGRMPRVRFGQVDIANCYYTPVEGAASVQCGNESSINIRNCVFEGDQDPWKDHTEGSYFHLSETGSIFDGCERPNDFGDGDAFTPSYPLNVIPADEVIAAVTGERGAGATLNVVENEGVITDGSETPEPEPEPEPEPTETRTWDFTTWSAETIANIEADATNWEFYNNTTDRYHNLTEMSGTLTANNTAIAETDGLAFGTLKADKIRINNDGDNSIQLNGSKLAITVPDCQAGDIVTIDFKSGKSTETRGWTVTNATVSEGEGIMERTKQSFTVATDGDITFSTTSGLNVYAISVATQGESPDPEPEPDPDPQPEESRTWDFTAWSMETVDNLAADATNWAFETGKDRYNNVTVMSGTLEANGVAIAETDGLVFGNLNASKVRIDYGSGRLQLNGGNLTVTIPGCKEGGIVTIDFNTASGNGEARGWTVTNATVSAGELISERTQQSFTVATDGDITFSTTGGLNIYTITYKAPDATGIREAAGDDEVARTEYYSISGMRLDQPQQGLNIVRTIYKSGKTETTKAYIR